MYIYQFEKKSTSSRLKINNFQIYALPSDKDVLLFTKTSRGENLLVDNNGLLYYSKKPNNYVPVQERKTSLWPPRPGIIRSLYSDQTSWMFQTSLMEVRLGRLVEDTWLNLVRGGSLHIHKKKI